MMNKRFKRIEYAEWVQIKAQVLSDALKEDRQEIRTVREAIDKIAAAMLIGSFSVSAFALRSIEKDAAWQSYLLLQVLADVAAPGLLWSTCLPLKPSLDACRAFMEAMEKELDTMSQEYLSPYRSGAASTPSFGENGVFLPLGLVSVVISGKIVLILAVHLPGFLQGVTAVHRESSAHSVGTHQMSVEFNLHDHGSSRPAKSAEGGH